MNRTLLKSKIHRATVTGADLNYEGSISIDEALIKKADLVEYEKVDIFNINNGERFSTYIITGKRGEISLNGAAARKVQPGDLIIIVSFAAYDESEIKTHKPRILILDNENRIKAIKS
jgi:aspartate 1-decarboxylase